MNYITLIIFILIYKSYSYPCKDSENNCLKCNPITNLCFKCKFDNFIPDENGGCSQIKKCSIGINYCDECDLEVELCRKCEKGYYPDKYGGCSFTENCQISYKGKCLQCDDNFILIGGSSDLKFCKYKYSEDFKNCKVINKENGYCQVCEEGYFLNTGDFKCSSTEHCNESIYGICQSCGEGYYLNKKNNTCLLKTGNFLYCKQSLDEETCDICDEMSYLDKSGNCSLSNFCYKSSNGKCEECIPNYYLSSNENICSNSKNCFKADKDTGFCLVCESNNFMDTKDFKCKSNLEDNEFKYCLKVTNALCTECISGYKLSKDSKCSKTFNCLESENGKCIQCEKNYYLGLDNKCSYVKHCIYSDEYGCIECEDGFYYNVLYANCSDAIDRFENCKLSAGYYCSECKNNFYLNLNDSICVDNTQKGPFYKCALTDLYNEYCQKCIDGYYLGTEDNLCSLNENCKISKNENVCLECDENYCLDLKKGKCFENDYLENENDKIYYACEKTNKEGTKCEKCKNGYEVGGDGYCIDSTRCLEKKDGECIRCIEEKSELGNTYCANKVFGCVPNFYLGCLRCDNILDIYYCTECKEGYRKTFSGGGCEEIRNK